MNDYFSYEHFYVLYCKFWELDTDRDFLLSREDLSKMDNLTHTVLDRIFTQAGRRFTSGHPNKMGYEDFVCASDCCVAGCRSSTAYSCVNNSPRRLPDVRRRQDKPGVVTVLVPCR